MAFDSLHMKKENRKRNGKLDSVICCYILCHTCYTFAGIRFASSYDWNWSRTCHENPIVETWNKIYARHHTTPTSIWILTLHSIPFTHTLLRRKSVQSIRSVFSFTTDLTTLSWNRNRLFDRLLLATRTRTHCVNTWAPCTRSFPVDTTYGLLRMAMASVNRKKN
jgi:hypothetical protein